MLAALLPGLTVESWSVPEPPWILLPDLAGREQPAPPIDFDLVRPPALAPEAGRAPPTSSAPLV
jgi:hypothetical protein